MQWAGHTVSHIMQATQRGEPSSRRTSRCRLRRRGAYGRRSSGYWMVTAPRALFTPNMLSVCFHMFEKKRTPVSRSPTNTSTR
jgi:hypothetical protein